jgi:membrane fusion protein (multidrug efflux system)
MPRRSIKSLLAATGVAAAVLLGGCESETRHESGEHHGGRLLVSRPAQQDVEVTQEYVCQIHSNRHIELRALERGYLEEVAVNEGQRVEKGQLMFRILPLTYRAELQRAKAEAEAARLEYENTRRLAENNVVSETELALAGANYERAKAEVDLAQAHLGFTEIRAPFSGIMDRLHVREGSLVEEGEFLTTLSDNSHMWVYFNVPEAEYLDFAARRNEEQGRNVSLRMANGRVFPHDGRIAVIEADFNHLTGTIPFRADFPNPDALLRHGQTGNILMRTPIPGAVLVPQKATFEILDQLYVFVVGEDERVEQRRIGVREELEDVFVVDSGLSPDERILLEGLRQVREGDHIEFDFEEPDAVLASLKLPAE